MRGKGWTRFWIGIALLIALVATFAAEVLAQDGAAPSSQEPITLELSVNNWGDAVIQAIEEGVKRFEALNPGIKVEVRRRGTWDDFVVRVVSGVPPDVIAIGLSIGEHSEAGLIIPLDSYIGGDLREQIIPEMWSNFTWRGKVYGVPALEHGPRLGMVWNEAMLQESGLSVDPDTVMTWAEFFEYAHKLTRFDAAGNVVR
ncbi:MAG TPA: extracellular solute-binding protein, partial [Limnochordia bacterium]|nr:extracellular solute-binding protein [Limnochordia bacterium]